jgi:hypothetical protein
VSYSEENGQVVLTMSREDYDYFMLGQRWLIRNWNGSPRMLDLVDRLNSGNPNYRPYQSEKESTDGR